MDHTMIPVNNSSTVKGYSPYDSENRQMKVTFEKSTYIYSDVSEQDYNAFVMAESKGKAISSVLKDKPYKKL